MKLRACLNATTWAMLLAIARTNGLEAKSATSKAALVDLLAARLPSLVTDDAFLAALDGDIRVALHALANALQPVALHDFDRVYGPVRATARTREADPRLLARHPVSTAERILYAGLAYVVPEPHTTRRVVVVPTQWRDRFGFLSPAPVGDAPTAGAVPLNFSVALGVFLAALESTPPRLAHGRWLPPRFVQFLASLLHIPTSERPRERTAPYLAFLRYAAETLGLVTVVDEHLLPSPAAAVWLARSPSDRVADLWRNCILDPAADERWTSFHLPGYRLRHPAAFRQRIVERVAAVTLGDGMADAWHALEDLTPAARLDDLIPFWELEEHHDLGRDLAWQILAGPLAWLEVVNVALEPQASWRLTAQGRWLLGRGEPPRAVRPALLRLSDDGSIHLPDAPDLPALLPLAQWANLVPMSTAEAPAPAGPIPTGAQTPLPHFELTPASIARPISHGAQIGDLFTLLTQHAAPLATQDLQERLEGWAAARAPYTIRPAWLLTAPTGEHLDRALRRRSVRKHLRRRLDLTTVEIIPADAAALAETLGQRGFRVTAYTPPSSAPAAEPPSDTASTPSALPLASPAASAVADVTPGDALWLLTALHVYAYVARRLGQSSPPAAVGDSLAARLGPFAISQAQFAAEHLAVHLEHALAALDPFSQPLPQDRLLERLGSAIQSGETLSMTYWTANRPLPVTRRVQPRRIEWRGDTAYLIAYCYRRLAELTFRLDRIVELDDA